MKRRFRCIIFLALSLLLVCFIFSNSLRNGPESNAQSGRVTQWLQPILNPFGRIPEDTFHRIIRKLAHFTEFAALGGCLFGWASNLPKGYKRPWLLAGLCTLAVAVTDETIQLFTGRTAMFRDVLLDVSGATFGILFTALLLSLWQHLSKRGGKPSCPN